MITPDSNCGSVATIGHGARTEIKLVLRDAEGIARADQTVSRHSFRRQIKNVGIIESGWRHGFLTAGLTPRHNF